ncbi:MAG: hypothetical protein KKC01_03385 [Gammaproteobacteria bacterium]|nr:hypothetical protein [Gammaproteobacteria bacterium]
MFKFKFHALSGVAVLLLTILSFAVQAATLTVDSTVDVDPAVTGDGSCTLREAINDINAGAASADCPNGGGAFGMADTITFAPALSAGTITLAGVSLPVVTVALSIQGPVAGDPGGITISGDDASRVFVLQGGGTFTVEFNDMTLTAGNASFIHSGGAIASFTADVELNNVDLTNNFADLEGGALSVQNGNSASLNNCRVTDNTANGTSAGGGGGVFITGDLTLINSLIANNATSDDDASGGGAFVGGAATIVNSSITGNTTLGNSANGGGLAVATGSLVINSGTISGNQTLGTGADGGGIHLDEADAVISAATIAANAASSGNGGGILANNSDLDMVNTTVSGNAAAGDGGGILSSGGGMQSVTLVHTTVAFNTAGGPNADGVDLSSGTLTLNNSLVVQGDPAEPACRFVADSFVNSLATDASCTGTATTAASMNLLPLANYGGDTETHALGNGSVAIDAAPNDALCQDSPAAGGAGGADQRGVTRPQPIGGLCDLGAYEADGTAPLPVALSSTPAAPVAISENGGAVTLQACLPAATTASEDITVTLAVSGSATPGVDHDLSDGSNIVIATGSTCGDVLLSSIDDLLTEVDETVVVDIDAVMSASDSAFEASPPQQLTVTILDDDIIVQEVPVLSRFGMLLLLLSTVMVGLFAVSRRQT